MTPEIDMIKSNILACKTIPDVNHCYNHHHKRLAELWREGGDMRAMCHQVKNLKDYQIAHIRMTK